jgi:hypothetical protein
MRDLDELAKWCVERDEEGGSFRFQHHGQTMVVVASHGLGWDHVSVSFHDRCPTWEEMEWVKRKFFRDDETAMQLHVAVSDHISIHPHTLHLWRSQTEPIPLPPSIMV